jgi:hypothetical protein
VGKIGLTCIPDSYSPNEHMFSWLKNAVAVLILNSEINQLELVLGAILMVCTIIMPDMYSGNAIMPVSSGDESICDTCTCSTIRTI